jgi:Uncharacterized protein conserved in bacteria
MRTFFSFLLTMFLTVSTAWANPEIHINIPEFSLKVIDTGQVITTYNIAVGTPYEQTPTGTFAIFFKQVNPTWYPGENFSDRTPVPPGPDNPLGSRWMEFAPNYGIHGTNKGWDINYPVSGGCIRMQDADARQIYEAIPVGTPVYIDYQTILLIEKPDGLYVRILPDIYNKNTSNYAAIETEFNTYKSKYVLLKEISSISLKKQDNIYEIKLAITKEQAPSEINSPGKQQKAAAIK